MYRKNQQELINELNAAPVSGRFIDESEASKHANAMTDLRFGLSHDGQIKTTPQPERGPEAHDLTPSQVRAMLWLERSLVCPDVTPATNMEGLPVCLTLSH